MLLVLYVSFIVFMFSTSLSLHLSYTKGKGTRLKMELMSCGVSLHHHHHQFERQIPWTSLSPDNSSSSYMVMFNLSVSSFAFYILPQNFILYLPWSMHWHSTFHFPLAKLMELTLNIEGLGLIFEYHKYEYKKIPDLQLAITTHLVRGFSQYLPFVYLSKISYFPSKPCPLNSPKRMTLCPKNLVAWENTSKQKSM